MMERVLQFLNDAQVFYLATVDEQGQPHVRPFGAADIFDGKLYICTNNQKSVYKQLKENPKLEISAMAGDKWIRLRGEAREDDRIQARQAMLDAHPELAGMYKADDGLMVALALDNATAEICSMTEAPEIITFES